MNTHRSRPLGAIGLAIVGVAVLAGCGSAADVDSGAESLTMPKCGTPLSSFNGTSANSNDTDTGTVKSCDPNNANHWQCVEFVMRYFRDHFGFDWTGDAYELLTRAPLDKVDVRYNGDVAHPPVPGDMVVWKDGGAGHTAIVTAVGPSTVSLIEQNVREAKGLATVSYVNGKIANRFANPTLVTVGWAHAKSNTGTTTSVSSGSGDLVALKLDDTGTNTLEAHTLSRASKYSAFSLHTGTPLGTVQRKDWAFVSGDFDGDGVKDLYALSLGTDGNGSNTTEVHILSGASKFQTWLLHTATPLQTTDNVGWAFATGDYDHDGIDDLYVLNLGTEGNGSNATEVHILSGASHFQTYLLHAATPLGKTDNVSWAFVTGDYDGDGATDLYALSLGTKGNGSNSTEVHVLSGATKFQTWLLHTPTPLGTTNTTNWAFVSADYDGDGRNDVYFLSLGNAGNGTDSTEVHVLSAASKFQTWLLHTGTPLAPTDASGWAFVTQ